MGRLIFVAPALGIGGLQFHLVRLANGLSIKGYKVTIILLSRQAELVSQLNSSVEYRFALGRSSSPLTWLKIYREISRANSEAIIGWSTFPSLVLCLMKIFGLRTHVVATELNYPPLAYGTGLKSRVIHSLTRWLYGYADQINANSTECASYLKNLHPRSNVTRIFNPVELSRSKATSDSSNGWHRAPLRILTVGRLLNSHKGFDTLLKAMKIVQQTIPESKLLLIGEGPDRSELEDMIGSLSLSNSAFLHGADTNIKHYLDVADIFVLSSNYEGFPNVLIEAMMAGRVSVATDCYTGPSEIIEDGFNGFLAKVNDPHSLASKIITAGLLPNATRLAIEERARLATSEFSVDNAVARYRYDVLCERSHAQG